MTIWKIALGFILGLVILRLLPYFMTVFLLLSWVIVSFVRLAIPKNKKLFVVRPEPVA